jgi:hypothetical protein
MRKPAFLGESRLPSLALDNADGCPGIAVLQTLPM